MCGVDTPVHRAVQSCCLFSPESGLTEEDNHVLLVVVLPLRLHIAHQTYIAKFEVGPHGVKVSQHVFQLWTEESNVYISHITTLVVCDTCCYKESIVYIQPQSIAVSYTGFHCLSAKCGKRGIIEDCAN